MSATGQYSISQMLERTLVSLVSIHRIGEYTTSVPATDSSNGKGCPTGTLDHRDAPPRPDVPERCQTKEGQLCDTIDVSLGGKLMATQRE